MAEKHPDLAAADALAAEASAGGLALANLAIPSVKPRDEAGGPVPELAWAARLDGDPAILLYRTVAEPKRLVLAWNSAQRFDGWYLVYPGDEGFLVRKARDYKFRDLVKRAPDTLGAAPVAAYALSHRVGDAIETRTTFVPAVAASGLLTPGAGVHYSTRAAYVFMDARRAPTLEAARALARLAAPVEAALAGMAAAEAGPVAAPAHFEGACHPAGGWMYGSTEEPVDGTVTIDGTQLAYMAVVRRRATGMEAGGLDRKLRGALTGLVGSVMKVDDANLGSDEDTSKGERALPGAEWKFAFRKSAVTAVKPVPGGRQGVIHLTMIDGDRQLAFRTEDFDAVVAALAAHRYPLDRG